jgi:p-cumate 2,3-dioxygenase alpha subunit
MTLNGQSFHGLVQADRAAGRFLVHRDAYRSREVFDVEQERVFGRCWLYLAHESELRRPGDFLTRRVANRDLLFTRDKAGKYRAFYNSCTHRGARICREKHGNRKSHVCPYHGWVFNGEGRLVNQGLDGGYPKDFNAQGRYDLHAVARLDDYRGFYFVNFNAQALPLRDYLAGAKEMIDMIADQSEVGLEIIGVHEYAVNGNYKYMCENSYDGYHAPFTHPSYFNFLGDVLKGSGDAQAVEQLNTLLKRYQTSGTGWGVGRGHGLFEVLVPNGRPVAYWIPSWGAEVKQEIESVRARLEQRLGTERARRIAELHRNLVIFPNLILNDHVATTVRVVQPEGPGRMRVTAYAIGPRDESPLLRKIRLDNFLTFLGPAGFATPDDNEALEICQTAIEHTPIEWTDLSRCYTDTADGDPLLASGQWAGEQVQRAYWTQWDRVMSGFDTLER